MNIYALRRYGVILLTLISGIFLGAWLIGIFNLKQLALICLLFFIIFLVKYEFETVDGIWREES